MSHKKKCRTNLQLRDSKSFKNVVMLQYLGSTWSNECCMYEEIKSS